jgi:hypothetical protein
LGGGRGAIMQRASDHDRDSDRDHAYDCQCGPCGLQRCSAAVAVDLLMSLQGPRRGPGRRAEVMLLNVISNP